MPLTKASRRVEARCAVTGTRRLAVVWWPKYPPPQTRPLSRDPKARKEPALADVQRTF